ncbi:MAG: N-acetyltransferase [Burkholderiales bacterium]|nr:N-acetyltransferase [Burkholderiales bacterium]
MPGTAVTIEVVDSLSGVSPAVWNRLADGDPFLRHEFLSALHETGCASAETGWTPQYLLLRENGTLAGAMPLYLKTHSYGEYVFDWAWADAYYRHGLHYYPKLLSAIPFTPVSGRRVLADTPERRERLIATALELARELKVSSLHCLLPPAEQAACMAAQGMMLRHGVQFHWTNRGYGDFEDFLAGLNHAKRKKIRQERRKVRDAGIAFEWLEGAAIGERDWAFFSHCYRKTYSEHHSTPYLNLEFFQRIGAALPRHMVLIVAKREDRPIAASFCVRGNDSLYGRYWGALEFHPALHFEACYYQGIEYCIARGLRTFEGGAQGEHKIARGLLPVETCSAHWLAHPEFSAAVENFLAREARGMAHYIDELNERSPFKSAGAAEESK